MGCCLTWQNSCRGRPRRNGQRYVSTLVVAEGGQRHWQEQGGGGEEAADGGGEAEPLQAGSVRQMGVMKPWAPSRSYGLVVRLGGDLVPTASYHSRADGSMHGIASTAELDGVLYAASRGSGTLLRIPVAGESAT